ncbi:MAG: hypothetical protein IMW96_12300, partial [Thermoanaerobacteraceae bacterium]|nr:hypothetical protein [Thermoanaerobacteraceae bacterium]
DDEVGMATVRGLGKAIGEAVWVTSMGRSLWEEKKRELGVADSGPVRDHAI